MAKLISGRVKKTPQSGITSDRYQFLGLSQAEPDLGDPIIGPSSTAANPYTGDISDLYLVTSDGLGTRYWTRQPDIIAGGIVSPGSITVRDEGVIVGGTNQVTDINFIGSAVSVTSPASWIGAGSSSVDIDITVTDFAADGSIGNIQFKGFDGLIEGSNDLFYDSLGQRVGLGTTLPTQKLDVRGNVIVSGITTTNQLNANSSIVSNFTIDQNSLTINVGVNSIGIGTTLSKATLDVLGTVNISGILTASKLSTTLLAVDNIDVTGITTSNSYYIGGNEVISSSRQLKNIVSLDDVTITTIETAIANAPNTFTDLNVTGIGTIQTLNVTDANIIGVATVGLVTASNVFVSGTATVAQIEATTIDVGFSTALNAWVSGVSTVTTLDSEIVYVDRVEAVNIGIGTTNPQSELDIVGDIRLSGAIYDVSGSSGVFGQVLLSNGSSPVTWGNPTSIAVGSATSVSTNTTSTNTSYYLTFVPQDTGFQSIFLDSDSLTYNPSTNILTVDSINVNNLEVGGLNSYNVGIVTTASKNEVVIDSFDTNLFRSARYNIQVNTIGQLTTGNDVSVTGLNSGTNYYPGIYENVILTNVVGTGTDVKATISVYPETTLSVVGFVGGTFTTTDSTLGVTTSQTTILGNVESFGPGYASTSVYYIQPLTVNTFELYTDISLTNKVVSGISTLDTPFAYVGGGVTSVEITYGGSGYQTGDILSASSSDLDNISSANVGTGFSFTASNIVQNYQISDIMLLQSVGSANTTADIIEYGSISNLDSLVEFSADINSSNARLKVIPKYENNTIKIIRTSITK